MVISVRNSVDVDHEFRETSYSVFHSYKDHTQQSGQLGTQPKVVGEMGHCY